MKEAPKAEEVAETVSEAIPIEEPLETVQGFLARIASPLVTHQGWIETNPVIFKYFMGESKTDYFWYKNIKVFVYGQREAIEEKELKQVGFTDER